MSVRKKLVVTVVIACVLALSAGGAAFAATTDEAAPASTSTATLSPHVTNHLVVLREQEKLARDVFAVLYAKWNAQVFHNMAAAENRHMASVKTLLDRYGIADPVGSNPPGVFTNPKIQSKYGELVAKGSKSLNDALQVGVALEKAEIDHLADLRGDTTRPDIVLVVNNLFSASYNELSVFTHLLAK